MCGIVGYVGKQRASDILFDCLGRLEYRGYDSCGIAVQGSDRLQVHKEAVRVADLKKRTPVFEGTAGIGHTRWATHGVPSDRNAHPHTDCRGKIAVVHNGVISNYIQLKTMLIAEGHEFSSDTDTEVIAHLIEKYYVDDLMLAVKKCIGFLDGSYALSIIAADEPGKVVVARYESPLVIGCAKGEKFIASDVPAILKYCQKAIYLENGDVGLITAEEVTIFNHGVQCDRKEHIIDWEWSDIDKCGYNHFMLKEIYEQPRVIAETIRDISKHNTSLFFNNSINKLTIVACGTSYHAGLIGAYMIEELLGIATRVALGSEFNHRRVIYPDEAVAITQSGETADVLYAMRTLKSGGSKVMAITNVPGSTADRMADRTVFIKAGAEVSVAATKSFVGQLVALFQLLLAHPSLPQSTKTRLLAELELLPGKVSQLFNNEDQLMRIAKYISDYNSAFFIGRGINHPTALEGALKLKEVSYIHAEGYAAGELKHGPLALIQSGMPVIGVVIPDANWDSMLTSMREAKSRNAFIIAIADTEVEGLDDIADEIIRVPHTDTLLSPVINVVPMQLLAYYAAVARNCAIDFPRNLAKSVTVP